jgi:hypothetical protein
MEDKPIGSVKAIKDKLIGSVKDMGFFYSIPKSLTSYPTGKEDDQSSAIEAPPNLETSNEVQVEPNRDADEDNRRIIHIDLPPLHSEQQISPSPAPHRRRNPRWKMLCQGKERRIRIFWLVTIPITLAALCIIGIFVARTSDGNEDNEVSTSSASENDWDLATRAYELESMLSTVSDPSSFLDSVSPQARALHWMVYEDALLTSADDLNLFQRYAIILFAFTTNAELWRVAEPWYKLTGSHECSFEGVDCDLDKQVTKIDLWIRKISGTLPEEIGLLTELTFLRLGNNFIEGTIPDSLFMKLTKLRKLYRILGSF